jgi:hypothetical protein
MGKADDGELNRILAHQGWPVEFPKMKPPWSAPTRATSADADSGADGPRPAAAEFSPPRKNRRERRRADGKGSSNSTSS